MSRDERVGLVERDGDLSLSMQAVLLGVSRSSLYYRPVAPSPEEIGLKHRVDEIYTANPFYGARRITAQLRRYEFVVNRKAVQRQIREMGSKPSAPSRI
jgi:putative transposase